MKKLGAKTGRCADGYMTESTFLEKKRIAKELFEDKEVINKDVE